MQHMLRETDLSNQVKIIKTQDTCTLGLEVFAFISHIIFISTVRRSKFSFFDRQKAFGTVYDNTNAYNDAKQLDVKNMTIYGRKNHIMKLGV